MTYASAPPQRTVGIRGSDLVSVLVILALAASVSWYLIRDREYSLQQSAMGYSGLIAWLRNDGIEAREARGLPLTPNKAGLRILALFDTNLLADFVPPTDQTAFLATGTEYDITAPIILRKINTLPSVIIAPKWSRAARHSGFAHTSLLLPIDEASKPFLQLNVMEAPLRRPNARFMEFTAAGDPENPKSATLYAPQLFAPEVPAGCASILGNALGHLIIECEGYLRKFLAISDPDLMNNHGLRLGKNAELASDLIRSWSNDLPVLVDATTYLFTEERLPETPQRQWSDLLRLFNYPFSILWAGCALLVALALWRSWWRFGQPVQVFDDRIGASKSVSITAKARLLRMSGNDVALFEAHVAGRLRLLEETLFGRDTHTSDPIRRIFLLIERRDDDLAASFAKAAIAAQTPTPGTSAARLLELAVEFEKQSTRVMNEFRRSP